MSKIFDNFEEYSHKRTKPICIITKCDECEHWWNNTCDGVRIPSEGSNLTCKSFLPTRKVVIPKQIKALKTQIMFLRIWCAVLTLLMLVNLFK
jgi:hypothetical protein